MDYFYSDPHFGHKAIIDLCDRPFANVGHMNESLINRYNKTVGEGDLVLWLGDAFFLNFEKSKAILDRLHGRKLIITGNHDRSNAKMVEMGFELATDECFVRMGEHRVRCSHFPYRSDDESERFHALRPLRVKGEYLIHGHTHSETRRIGNEIHVGVDAWDYYPVPRARVNALINGY